jgi:hypothetical protein
LLNMNVVSSEPSVLDRRANIYYPVGTKTENKNLFDFASSNNISQSFQIKIENPLVYPDEMYVMNEIHRIIKYSSDKRNRLVDHHGTERSIHEIVYRYYANSNECFSIENRLIPSYNSSHNSLSYDLMITDHITKEYSHNHQNNDELYICRSAARKNAIIKREQSIKLFDSSQSNNFLFPRQNNS